MFTRGINNGRHSPWGDSAKSGFLWGSLIVPLNICFSGGTGSPPDTWAIHHMPCSSAKLLYGLHGNHPCHASETCSGCIRLWAHGIFASRRLPTMKRILIPSVYAELYTWNFLPGKHARWVLYYKVVSLPWPCCWFTSVGIALSCLLPWNYHRP